MITGADNSTGSYFIRYARTNDLAELPAIERRAAELFRNTPYPFMADADLASKNIKLEQDFVWVVVDLCDNPIGFAIVNLLDDATIHLHEIDVDPRHSRKGLGRRLIETIADWSRTRDATALTLMTFSDVQWNGPYYERLGFYTLDVGSLPMALQIVRQREQAAGLPMAKRICMQLDF